MERVVYTLIGILALALVASGLTEVTMAVGRSQLVDDQAARMSAQATPTPSVRPTASPSPTTTPTPTPAATPTPAPVVRTATANSYVHMRSGPSTSTAIVTDLYAGYVVTLGAYSDTQWQEATYNGTHGYIYKAYLTY